MAINLSNITFTDESDILPSINGEPTYVPEFIILSSATVNTLAGDDVITGSDEGYGYGFLNSFGTLNTNSGNDLITGSGSSGGLANRSYYPDPGVAIINTGDGHDRIEGIGEDFGIYNDKGTIDTGDGNDVIFGIGYGSYNSGGIINEVTTIDTGNGDDLIEGSSASIGIDSRANTNINTGNDNDTIRGYGAGDIMRSYSGGSGWGILLLSSAIDTGEGNDIIEGSSYGGSGICFSSMDFGGESRIDTGEGDDIITGIGFYDGIFNSSTVNTGNGADSIISQGRLFNSNSGIVFLGDGNDSITANTVNSGDITTSAGIIYNEGTIDTGNGADSIMGDEGFKGIGYVFLGEGEDYIKGFGSGKFSGGNGFDTLELTSGSYIVGIAGTAVNFTKGSTIMETSDFDILKAGNLTYNFANFNNGQTIFVP
jgi:hypothetical protein